MASTTAAPSSTVATAFAVATVGIALFSGMDAVMKGLAIAIGAFNAVFWRMLIGLAMSGALYLPRRPARPGRQAMRFHVIRGLVGSVMALTFFWGLARMPLAEAVALSFVAPLLSLYLAAMLLKEPVGKQAVLASVVGFSGVLVILSSRIGTPGDSDLWGAASVLLSAMLYAYNIVLMRQQALVAKPLEIAFYQYLIIGAALGVAAPFVATFPPADQWPSLLFAALLALISLMLLAWSYARAEAHRLAPVEYTALIWAALFGLVFFAEPIAWTTLVGAGLIVTGCIIAARTASHPVPAVEAMP